MNGLGVSAVPDSSLEGYRGRVRERMKERRQAFRKREILGEWPEAKRIEQAGYWEWLGDYPEEAARRKSGQNLRPLVELSPTYRVPQDDALERMNNADENASDEKSKE